MSQSERALAICKADLGLSRLALAEARQKIRSLEEALVPTAEPQRPGLPMNRSTEVVLMALRGAKAPLNHDALCVRLEVALNRRGRGVNPRHVDVIICRLRRKLKALTPPIFIETARSRGWWMTDENKALLRAFYES